MSPEFSEASNLDTTQLTEANIHAQEALREQLKGCEITEIELRQESIAHSSEVLIGAFDLQPELFNNPGNSIIFAAIADRHAQLDDIGHEETELAGKEKTFITDAVVALGFKYLGPRAEEIRRTAEQFCPQEALLAPEVEMAAYDKYTDPELTLKINEAVNNGLLDGVKEKLGITPDNEDPYEIRVLDIGTDRNWAGMEPSLGHVDFDNSEELQTRLEEYDQESADFRKWSAELFEKAGQFMEEVGLKGEKVPPAWVSTIGDKKILALPTPLAQKILNRDKVRSNYYTDDDWQRDFAYLEHEYTHTQGGLHANNSQEFGIGMEELRAEHFSGDRTGYQDIKGFWQDVVTATGLNLKKTINEQTKGGTQEQIYSKIANELGLNNMLELLIAAPKPYREGPYKLVGIMNDRIGGFDGVLKNLIEQQLASGNQDKLNDRIEQRAKILIDHKTDVEFVHDYRRQHGLNVVTELVDQRYKQLVA